MNNAIRAIVCLSVGAWVSGCATTPPDPDLTEKFVPVVTHKTKDINLSCEELASEIGQNEHVTAILDKQIANQQQQSQTMAMLAAFSGWSAATANNPLSAQLSSANQTLATVGEGMANRESMTAAQLHANYNQRHDALIQIYFARRCKSA
jgi:hypothetical protein